ncbi:MAG: DUF4199 family protein [Saprospiraceae bacterium]
MKNTPVRYGLLGGVAVIFYFLLLYILRPEFFLNPWLQWASLLIYLLCMYRATREDVLINGSQRDFRTLLRSPFIVFLLINIAYWVFYYALHLFDPGLLQMETALDLDFKKNQLAAGLGDPQQANQLREQILSLERESKLPQVQPLGPIIFRLAIGSIGGFLLAAGVAALARFGANENQQQ